MAPLGPWYCSHRCAGRRPVTSIWLAHDHHHTAVARRRVPGGRRRCQHHPGQREGVRSARVILGGRTRARRLGRMRIAVTPDGPGGLEGSSERRSRAAAGSHRGSQGPATRGALRRTVADASGLLTHTDRRISTPRKRLCALRIGRLGVRIPSGAHHLESPPGAAPVSLRREAAALVLDSLVSAERWPATRRRERQRAADPSRPRTARPGAGRPVHRHGGRARRTRPLRPAARRAAVGSAGRCSCGLYRLPSAGS